MCRVLNLTPLQVIYKCIWLLLICFNMNNRSSRIVIIVRERQIHLFTPNIFFKSGIVNKRISILLNSINGFVPCNLFRTYRVVLCPFYEHIHLPILVWFIRILSKNSTSVFGPSCYLVFVSCGHVEIIACHIAFIFIIRLEHNT